MNFKFDIIRYLDEHRITLVAAARAAGMAPQNIKKCLAGNPKIENILAVANGLGIDPREFFYTEETNIPEQTPLVQTNSTREQENFSPTQPLQTTTFCPHCGAKVKVGVVLLAE